MANINIGGYPVPVHFERIDRSLALAPEAKQYDTFWRASFQGHTWLLARGHKLGPNQIVGWYENGHMWSSYSKTLEGVITGMVRDGWKYAIPPKDVERAIDPNSLKF